MVCIVTERNFHPGYCRYSWGSKQLLEYLVHGHYRAEPASFWPGYDTVATAVTEPLMLSVVQKDSGMGTPLSVETVLDCRDGKTLWAAMLSAGRPPPH